ncbi:type III secretion system inner rod subunit SctI [Burkholderia ubonensis]|uniref:type III secretion system inner rod subunit SctI n=1 Tax=Burkholderia ubonensis TaxID=101571 RepID=UPI00075D1F92|nr:type III secretion system inner rod subunit SctI [Burkholderia ubonensis]KWN63606.1 type III secretion system protein [Burkholderia ubonensis]
MDVTATQTALETLRSQYRSHQVDPKQIDDFTRALFGQDSQSPEMRAVADFQQRSNEADRILSSARNNDEAATNPSTMLVTQSEMLHSIIKVDLAAKAAGAVSQSVNKLVHMQ